MNILAFDCCLAAVSVAVRRREDGGEWLLHEACEERTSGQAERLLPMIGEVMARAGLGFAQVDRIAVTVGPGSFTGIRAAVATARGLGLATGKETVAMSSLRVMAARADELLASGRGGRHPLAVIVDARRGAVYMQLFGEGPADERSPPALLSVAEAARLIAGRPTLAVGSGAIAVAALAGDEVEAALPGLHPHARILALAAPELAPVMPLQPLYLRPADAKPEAGKRLAGI